MAMGLEVLSLRRLPGDAVTRRGPPPVNEAGLAAAVTPVGPIRPIGPAAAAMHLVMSPARLVRVDTMVSQSSPMRRRGDRASGFCLRAPAQGACTDANICEHCPSFHAEPSSLPILAAQRIDAEALAADAEKRSWIAEAERHRRLITRLDALISEAQAG